MNDMIYYQSYFFSPIVQQMGEIVNYMQLDTGRMEYVASSIHTIWDGILQVTYSLPILSL